MRPISRNEARTEDALPESRGGSRPGSRADSRPGSRQEPRVTGIARIEELAIPQRQKPRSDKPSRATEFSAKDLPPSLQGLMVDESPGVVKCISSGEKFRSNDYRSISAHWYNGQKKAYVSSHQCRSNGELIRKRTDMPPFFPGDSKIQLPTILQTSPSTMRPVVSDVTLQRECRPFNLPLEAVFD